MSCPTCHSPDYTLESGAAAKPTSFLRRLFGGSRSESSGSTGPRRCRHCGTVYEEDSLPDDDSDERRIEERRARMEERMSGFKDSSVSSSLFPEEDELLPPDDKPVGRTPPKPYRAPTLEELSKLASGIEMHKPEGIKCRKCGHFAFLVRTPESKCAGCGRVYDKMDEEAEAERQEAIRKAEKKGN